jgi:hypothetical protein
LGATHKPNGTVDAFVSTLIIGHLVVQVWGGAGDGVYEPFKAVATSTADSVMIYPPASGVVAWPPPRLLEEEDLDRFIREPYAYASDSAELLEWRDRRRAAED